MTQRLAYLGPAGTFTEEAALSYSPNAHLIPFPSVSAVGVAVGTGIADEGVVAIENSLEGSVNDTLDLLIHESTLLIRREVVIPIDHCLLVREKIALEEVSIVFSHPQALGQCRRFLTRWFPHAQAIAALSTAAAVEHMMASDLSAAAIGPKRSAHIYGATILAEGLQDNPANATRFVVLASTDHPSTGYDKTLLCFSFTGDNPGLLHGVLGELAERQINLAKVESRPSREALGNYIFLVELEGHRDDSKVRKALEGVERRASNLKILGSYPRHSPR